LSRDLAHEVNQGLRLILILQLVSFVLSGREAAPGGHDESDDQEGHNHYRGFRSHVVLLRTSEIGSNEPSLRTTAG